MFGFKWLFGNDTVEDDPITVPDGALEKYWDAEFDRAQLQKRFEAERRDQIRKVLSRQLIQQTTLCLKLERQAGIS